MARGRGLNGIAPVSKPGTERISAGAVPNGSYTTCTGYVRPDTSMTGTFACSACSKCSWNFTESIVADVMTSFRSRRLGSSAVR